MQSSTELDEISRVQNHFSQLARHSKVSLELVRKIERYRKFNRGLLLNSYDKSDIVTLRPGSKVELFMYRT